jgi:hypothetical protein
MDAKPVDLSHVQFGPKGMACTPLERRFAYILGAGLARSASDAAALAGYSTKSEANKVRASKTCGNRTFLRRLKRLPGQSFAA